MSDVLAWSLCVCVCVCVCVVMATLPPLKACRHLEFSFIFYMSLLRALIHTSCQPAEEDHEQTLVGS